MRILNSKKNYFVTLVSSFGAMFISIIISFISVPISLNYWKPEKYGMWALISTVLVYLGNSNLGLNATASTLICKNNNFKIKMKALNRTTKILLICMIFFLILFILLNRLNKNWIFIIGKIPPNLVNETYSALLWAGILLLINVPISNISSALSGFQMLYIEKLLSMLSSFNGFIILLIIIFTKGSLVIFAILNGLSNILVNIIKILFFYFKVYKFEKSQNVGVPLDLEDDVSYKNIIFTSLRFFLIGIAAMIVWNTDSLVISHLLSIKDITPYSITFKLYSIIFGVIFIANGSMMPLFGKEIGNQNWDWLNKIYSTMLIIISVLGGLTWIGGVLFFRDLIYLWAGKEAYGGLLTVFSLGGYSYLLCIVNLNSGILNAFNHISKTVLIGWMEAIINIILSITFVKYYGIGGAALGTFIGSLLSCAWLFPIVIANETNNRLNINKDFLLKHLFFIIIPLIIISVHIQIFIDNMVLRIVAGCIVSIVYLLISYIIIPKGIKQYMFRIVRPLLIKVPILEKHF